jgi:hypothetical protein
MSARPRGKWSDPGIPHKGWECIDFEDLDEPSETCEMCEFQTIRYVHVMRHPEYPSPLRCGCDALEQCPATTKGLTDASA